jgi:methanogenic corrinoid protein MtbC1
MRSSLEFEGLGQPHGDREAAVASWAALPSPQAGQTGTLVRTLQQELIPRLARAHRSTLAQLTEQDVEAFTAELLEGADAVLQARVDSLRKKGFSNDVLCLDLLAPAARRLGSLWDDDRCDFTSVTIGVGRLQRLMRLIGAGALAAGWVAGGEPPPEVLLAQPPHEQHSFGLAMVAEFFRGAGWAVASGAGETDTGLVARVRQRHFDVIGLSVGAETQLDWLRRQVPLLRAASRNRRLVVMVGGPLLNHRPDLIQALGADLGLASASEAPGAAERLVREARAPSAAG